jgi:hypothetical protein
MLAKAQAATQINKPHLPFVYQNCWLTGEVIFRAD